MSGQKKRGKKEDLSANVSKIEDALKSGVESKVLELRRVVISDKNADDAALNPDSTILNNIKDSLEEINGDGRQDIDKMNTGVYRKQSIKNLIKSLKKSQEMHDPNQTSVPDGQDTAQANNGHLDSLVRDTIRQIVREYLVPKLEGIDVYSMLHRVIENEVEKILNSDADAEE